MLNCPFCKNEMIWNSDYMDDEILCQYYDCPKCGSVVIQKTGVMI